MLDRTKAPQAEPVSKISFQQVEPSRSNNCDLFILNAGEQDAVRLELIFDSGIWNEVQPQAARFTAAMLKEGTKNLKSSEVAEIFASQGAFLDIKSGFDRTTLTVYCLSRSLVDLLPTVSEIITSPAFRESDLSVLKDQALQKHKIDLEKSSFLASSYFRGYLFGQDHPYGRIVRESDINAITTETLKKHHQNSLLHSKLDIHLAGKVNDTMVSSIDSHISKHWAGDGAPSATGTSSNDDVNRVYIEKKQSLQTSLRIGRNCIRKVDKDFPKLVVANEIFGGFFGSRLMKNIREEKGFTYGIYSQVVPLKQESYFVIGSDVIKESRDEAIDEIRKELLNLIQNPPEDGELELVKNYMIGSFQSEVNTAFALADKFKGIHYHGLGYEYYDTLFGTIRNITPSEISDITKQYLDPDSLLHIAVG